MKSFNFQTQNFILDFFAFKHDLVVAVYSSHQNYFLSGISHIFRSLVDFFISLSARLNNFCVSKHSFAPLGLHFTKLSCHLVTAKICIKCLHQISCYW